MAHLDKSRPDIPINCMTQTIEAPKEISRTRLVMNIFFALFWFMSTYCFVIQVLHLKNSVQSILQLAGEVILVVLAAFTLRRRIDWTVIISFLILAAYTNVLNDESWLIFINGLRTYLPMLLLPPIIRFMLSTRERAAAFIHRMDKSLFVFLLIQLPCMIVQLRTAPDGNPDYVGGSLGDFASGLVSVMIYVASFYLMRRRWDQNSSSFENLKRNWFLLALLLPTFFNETKISFVYLALYFLLLVPLGRKFIKNILPLFPLAAVMIIGGMQLYMKYSGETSRVFSKEYINEYILGADRDIMDVDEVMDLMTDDILEDADYWISSNSTSLVDYPRGIKFMMIPIVFNEHRTGGWLFGYGIGQYKGGSLVGQSEFAKKHNYLITGTMISGMVIMVELGLFGMVWLIFYLLVLLGAFRKWRLVNWNLRLFILVMIIISLLYGPNMFYIVMMSVVTYVAMMSVRWRLTEMLPRPDTSLHRVMEWLHIHPKRSKSSDHEY